MRLLTVTELPPVLAGIQDQVHGHVRHDAALGHAHAEPLRGAHACAVDRGLLRPARC